MAGPGPTAGTSSPQANKCPAAALVTGPTRAEPGLASACSAAARPTTSPTAPYSTRAPPPMGPSTAGPVSTPIRRVPPSTDATDARARKAALAARSGSSSCASGAPNMAWSPPPDTDVTVPPSASTSAITAARQRPATSRSSSGSAGSIPSAATSAASTVTVLSSSRAGVRVRGGAASKAAVVYTSSSHGDRPSPSSSRAARQRS